MRVYMDNSATSFPKPKQVTDAMVEYMLHSGTNISRSTSSQADATADKLFVLRETLADFFHASDSRNVVFTKNITEALNIVIKGFLQTGDTVMTSSVEHNAVIRPLVQQGVNILSVPVSREGVMDLDFVKKHLPNVKAFFCTHVSNVSGDVMPIEVLAELCRERTIPFILDSAQSAGLLPIDMEKTPIDCLCFTGHKSILGPTGTGGMIIDPEFAKKVPPFITGGTGR
ncbi:MAG: aminotransferase class V-fold PLP-dependent enzyme, partial [Filifactor alocis]|nr:aminotransferase class V-fold PLP-dependent enzyme [Filifactor alocis]